MKKLLTLSAAGSALAAAGCTTAAMATDDQDMHHNVQVVMTDGAADSQSIIIRGVDVEVIDGDVVISGDAIRTDANGRVIISDGHADVLRFEGRDHPVAVWTSREDGDMRLAEIESRIVLEMDALENMEALRGEEMERALAQLETELNELEGERYVVINGERREMTDEEREEVRIELMEAREDIRDAMANVEVIVGEHGDRREALRVMRVELANAREEMRHAEAEARRAEIDHRRAREEHEAIVHVVRENGARRVRIESENDGEPRVWIDGEELEGDARTEWLNRLEIERLEGGNGRRSIVIEVDEDDTE